MNNTINVGRMTGYYNSFIQSLKTKYTSEKKSTVYNQNSTVTDKRDFKSTIDNKSITSSTEKIQEVDHTEVISTKDMTLDEYKQYIRDKISDIQMHPDRLGDCISINISDKGFKAMQDDPEYEKWVLQDIKNGFSTPLPGWVRAIGGTDYVVAHYGATREECNCTSWSMGYQGGRGDKIWESQSKGSFWVKRGEEERIQTEIEKKAIKKKEIEKKWLNESAERRQVYREFLEGKSTPKTNSLLNANIFPDSKNQRVSEIISAYENGTIEVGE